MIDLQAHTTASDGEQTPQELIDCAVSRGLKVIAITDHDVVDAVQPAIDYAVGKDIEVVPGIEIRCYEPDRGFKEIDVLGLLIDHTNKELVALTEHGKKERVKQKRKMITKLREIGLDIHFDEVAATVGGAFGRPHIAKFLLKKYPEKFSSIQDVFDKHIGFGKHAYVPREEKLSMNEAVRVIHASGGVAILAHPRAYAKDESLRLITLFQEASGDGIETYYPYYLVFPQLNIDENGNDQLVAFYKNVAQERGLLESGGCDHHGNKRDTMAVLDIPLRVLEKLKEAAKKYR